jgi:hypothetical protein
MRLDARIVSARAGRAVLARRTVRRARIGGAFHIGSPQT